MNVRDRQAYERVASDVLPCCPDCWDLAHPSATVCDGCGTHLFQRLPRRISRPHPAGCPCVRCTIGLYDEGLPL